MKFRVGIIGLGYVGMPLADECWFDLNKTVEFSSYKAILIAIPQHEFISYDWSKIKKSIEVFFDAKVTLPKEFTNSTTLNGFKMKDKSRLRHIFKVVTWRLIASATTFSLALLFFGTAELAKVSWLSLIETGVKILFYYIHERVWFSIAIKNHKTRHLFKAITWRIIASTTTFFLVYSLFSDQEGAMEKATFVALIESVLKMLFYYGHEEAWYRINIGLDRRKVN